MPALDILGFEIDDMPAIDILGLEIYHFLGFDILVHMPTFDIPADVLADFSILDMPALDILGLCFQAAAVGSPVCLMLVYSIPAAAVPLA